MQYDEKEYDDKKFEQMKKRREETQKTAEDAVNKLTKKVKFLFLIIPIVIILIVFIVLFFFDNMIQEFIAISGITAGVFWKSYYSIIKSSMELVNIMNDFIKNTDKKKED